MPSLAEGTNWTLQGRTIQRSAPGVSVKSTYKVTVVTADDLAVKWSQYQAPGTIVGNLEQQSVELSVVRTLSTGGSTTTSYKGIFVKQAPENFVSGANRPYVGQAIVADASGNVATLDVIVDSSINGGKQTLRAAFANTTEYSTLSAFTVRNA